MNNHRIYNIIIIFFTIIFAFSLSVYKRNWQFNKWKEDPAFYFANNKLPAMSTLDAYFWLRYARDEVTGFSKKMKKDLRRYPDRLNYPHPVPIFSRILAKLYKFFSSENYDHLYVGSIKLCNIFSVLFVIPLIIYLYLSGGYLSGFLGALIGSFSLAYYTRSSTGRVDTDGLIMFIPFFISLLLLLVIKLRNIWLKFGIIFLIALILKILSGMHIAVKATMILYFILLIIALFLNKEDIKITLGLIVCYLIICNPLFIIASLKEIIFFINSSYFLGAKYNSLDSIKKTIETVGEAQKIPFSIISNYVISNMLLFFIGIVGSIWYFIKNFKNSIFLLPIFLLGIFSLFSSLRFSMFLAPFIGIGLGYILILITKYVLTVFGKYSKFNLNIISTIIIIIFFFAIKNVTGYNFIPKPQFPTPIVEDILKLKEKLPKNSVFFTWWDLGYAYEDIGRFITFIDGGIEDIPRRFAVATGFLLDNQTKLRNLIAFVSNNGFKKLTNTIIKNDNNALNEIFKYNEKIKNNKIYLVFSFDLLEKTEVLDNYAFMTTDERQDFALKELPCYYLIEEEIICENFKVDIKKGKIYGALNLPLEKIIYSINGKVEKEFDFPEHHSGKILEIIENKMLVNVRLVSKHLYKTVFNQMFLLGFYDNKLFEEVYNDFPFLRVFRVK